MIDPEPRHWYAVEVTYVKSPGEFYVRFPLGIDNSLGQGRERRETNLSLASVKTFFYLAAPYPDEMEPNQMLNDLHRNMA